MKPIKTLSQKKLAELKKGILPSPRPMIRSVKSVQDYHKLTGVKKRFVGAEIGVLNGENALSILQTLDMKKLYLIDPYEVHDEYLEIKAPVFSTIRKRAEKNLEPFKDKIVWVQKKSSNALSSIPDDLDFIYIDGNHSYKNCLEDIKNYFPKVKKGGVVGGHDYYNMNKAREVKKAVDEFAAENKLKVYSAVGNGLCDWWIMK